VPLLLLAALALAACGGGPDDRTLARRAVLTLEDLPPGWTATGAIGRPDDAAATRAFERASSVATMRCCAQGVVVSAEKVTGATASQSTVARLPVAAVSDESAATRLVLPLTDGGQHVDLYADLVFVRSGRALSVGLFVGEGRPFDAALRNG
jgi:hypothetical protein